jgi:hypothetical protein
MSPDEPGPPRTAQAGRVSGSSGLRRPQRRIGRRARTHRLDQRHWDRAVIAHGRIGDDLDRRCDVIAVAAAMMVRKSLVAIRRHFVRIAGRVALDYLLARRRITRDADIRTLQRVRGRRRSQGSDEREASKDVQQASHVCLVSSIVVRGIALQSSQQHGGTARRAEAKAQSLAKSRGGCPPPPYELAMLFG